MEDGAPSQKTIDALATEHPGSDSPVPHSEISGVSPFISPSERYVKYSDDLLGKGAFKAVYRAFDLITGREVAWNEVSLESLEPMTASKIFQELTALKVVKHENIINLYHHWFEGRSLLVFTTELMPSGSLRSYLKKGSLFLTAPVLKRWALQILRALHHMHSHNPKVIHRDLKAQNIFINGATGTVKVGDLGLCASLGAQTTAVSCIGTPEFMAPETYSNDKYDEKVDIYSFGMLLIELITRDSPYIECKSILEVVRKITNSVVPSSFEKIAHKGLREVILKCIATNPVDRPSAYELLSNPCLNNMQDTEKLSVDPKETKEIVPAIQPVSTVHDTCANTQMHQTVLGPTDQQIQQAQQMVGAKVADPAPVSVIKKSVKNLLGTSDVSVVQAPQKSVPEHGPAAALAPEQAILLSSGIIKSANSTVLAETCGEKTKSVEARTQSGVTLIMSVEPSKESEIRVIIQLPNQTNSFAYVFSCTEKISDVVDELELVKEDLSPYKDELIDKLEKELTKFFRGTRKASNSNDAVSTGVTSDQKISPLHEQAVEKPDGSQDTTEQQEMSANTERIDTMIQQLQRCMNALGGKADENQLAPE